MAATHEEIEMSDLLQPDSVYGFADHEEVAKAIEKRLSALNGDTDAVRVILGQAVRALIDINANIPVQNRHRHLIANELERFANGPTQKETPTTPA